jgi:multidrug efflux system outer membrane protein
VLALLAVGALSACSQPQRDAVNTPALPLDLPSNWTAKPLNDGKLSSSLMIDLSDKWLAELITEALTHSPDALAAEARLREAEAMARVAGADRLPSVGAGASASRSQFSFSGPGGRSSLRETTYGVGLDMSWELDIWGRIRSGTAAAYADLEAAEVAWRGTRLSLTAQVAKAYLSALTACLQEQVAADTASQAADLHERLVVRYRSGLSTAVDLKLTESAAADAAARLAQLRRLKDSALRQLEVLVGRYPSAGSDLAPNLPAMPEAVPVGLPVDLLNRRPDVVAAERRYRAAQYRIDEAWAARLPRISLTGSAGTTSDEAKNLLNGNFGVWSLAAGVTQPIFDGGRLAALQDAAEARAWQAGHTYVSRVLGALAEVEVALAADDFLANEAEQYTKLASSSAEALELAESRYREGMGDILSVLRSRQELGGAKLALLSTQSERLLARINLYIALGGGWEAEARDGLEKTDIMITSESGN